MNTVKNIFARFEHLPAGLQLAIGAALISFSGVYVKLARVTPAAAGFYRMAFGGLVLLAMIALRREIRWPGSKFFLLVGIQWGQFGPDDRIGVCLGLGAAICYAGFLLTLRQLQTAGNGVSAMATLTLVSFFTACFLALEIERTGDTFQIPDVQSVVLLVTYGVSSQAAGWVIITRALPRVRASFAGLVLLLQPTLSYVWDILFFDKIVTAVSMTGLVLTLFAIYLGSTRTAD